MSQEVTCALTSRDEKVDGYDSGAVHSSQSTFNGAAKASERSVWSSQRDPLDSSQSFTISSAQRGESNTVVQMNVYGNTDTSVESPSSAQSQKRKSVETEKQSVKKPLWQVEILPDAPSNDVVPTNTLSLEVPVVKNLMTKIASIKTEMVKEKKCVICHLVQKGRAVVEHNNVNTCPIVKSQHLCFSCLGSSCPMGTKCRIKFTLKLNTFYCYMCGIEESLHFKYHDRDGLVSTPYGPHCISIARDVVFPYIWYSRRLTDTIQRVNTHFLLKNMDDPAYRVWLYQSNHSPPLPNYLAVFAFLINHPLQ